MHFVLTLSLALFSTVSLAQFSLDTSLVNEVVSDFDAFVASLVTNPTLASDIPEIEALGVPTSAIAAAETNPVVLLEDIVADYTDVALLATVPTALGNSLRALLAKPLKAVIDVEAYLQQLLANPGTGSVLAELKEQVPEEIQLQLERSPIPFLKNLVEVTTVPAYFSAVPTVVQDDLASILNKGLRIVLNDLEGPGNATVTMNGTTPAPTAASTGVSPSGVFPSGGVPSGILPPGGYNATQPTAGTGRYAYGPRPTLAPMRHAFGL